MLPLAMLTGALTYKIVSHLSFLMPWLLFAMLLVTFCKLSPKQIKLYPAHIWLLLIQFVGSLLIYFAFLPFNHIVAQGAMMCVLAPTATAAAVITGMLGGDIAFLATFTLLSSIGVAIEVPILFPLINPQADIPFLSSFFYIGKHVAIILILPLLIAWFLRYFAPKIQQKIVSFHLLAFYLWSTCLILVTGSTINFIVSQENPNYWVEISLGFISLVFCVFQFWIGRKIGRHYGDAVSSGQGLGQKNTMLSIWMIQTYLNPIASIGSAGYILWQNFINSYQLWMYNHNRGAWKHE